MLNAVIQIKTTHHKVAKNSSPFGTEICSNLVCWVVRFFQIGAVNTGPLASGPRSSRTALEEIVTHFAHIDMGDRMVTGW